MAKKSTGVTNDNQLDKRTKPGKAACNNLGEQKTLKNKVKRKLGSK